MSLPKTKSFKTLDQFVEVSSYFQRAVHLRYDLDNPEALERYVPTNSAADAIGRVLSGVQDGASQRAYLLHAAYGSGKSLLSVVLASILSRNSDLHPAVCRLAERVHFADKNVGKRLYGYLKEDSPRLLPVVLVGDEGDLNIALPRALGRALKQAEIKIALNTRFEAALRVIAGWKENYQATYKQLGKLLKENGTEMRSFRARLNTQKSDAFSLFESLYPALTSGEQFDASVSSAPNRLIAETAKKLKQYGFDGIAILWDEFGRYLEARVSKVFGEEAAMLQDLAETCNYSGEYQVHLLLFAHKELQSYAAGLPKNYSQEWARIEGRFQRFNITNDPLIAYKLIASAFNTKEAPETNPLLEKITKNGLVNLTLDSQVFPLLPSEDISTMLRNTWPLHPLTVYSLARLSNRVSQNERTMFTFLTIDERNSFLELLREVKASDIDDPFIRPCALWDYFQDAVRSDSGLGGAHHVWSGVVHALDKVPRSDHFSQEIVKTLGVLLIASEGEKVRPTTDLVCWAMGAETQDKRAAVTQSLENLRRRKAVIHRQIDGYWNFTSGSDIDFEARLQDVLERSNPSQLQIRRRLQELAPPPFTVARRYNQKHAMTRYFTGLYRWPHEIENIPWETLFLELDNTDGIVVYLLPSKDVNSQNVREYLPDHERVVFVGLDEGTLSFEETLRELYGLYELKDDPMLTQQEDKDRVRRELDYLIEDAEGRLKQQLGKLTSPRLGETIWMTKAQPEGQRISSSSHATRFISEICASEFSQSPFINNEGINKRKPTSQQTKAAEKIIGSLFTKAPASMMGMEGRGPEILVCTTVLERTGILREEADTWVIARPNDGNDIQQIWDLLESFVQRSQQDEPQPLEALIGHLTAPPFGLRLGVIPVLFAAVLSNRLRAVTVRKNGRAEHPINGELITDLVFNPEDYTLEVGVWNDDLERLWDALDSRFLSFTHDADRNQEPLMTMKIAMLRWLQSLPRFCRDTQQLSPEVLQFRRLIREAQTEPAAIFTKQLPKILKDHLRSQDEIESQLNSLMSAIGAAYLDLQKRLDRTAQDIFGTTSRKNQDGFGAMKDWLAQMEAVLEIPIGEFRFSSPTTQAFVDTLLASSEQGNNFWDVLGYAVSGLHLRDWIDQSETNFTERLKTAREEIETETQALLADDDTAVAISIQLPGQDMRDFRFRSADISTHGQSVLQNLINTLKIAGRPLTADERRLISVELLRHVMGDEQND
jgi:hypothetical protein